MWVGSGPPGHRAIRPFRERVQGVSWLRGNRRGDLLVLSPSSAQCRCLLEDAPGSLGFEVLPGVLGVPGAPRGSKGSPPVSGERHFDVDLPLSARQVSLVFQGIPGALPRDASHHGSRYRGSHLRK